MALIYLEHIQIIFFMFFKYMYFTYKRSACKENIIDLYLSAIEIPYLTFFYKPTSAWIKKKIKKSCTTHFA